MAEYQHFTVRVTDGQISLTCLDCGAVAVWSRDPAGETQASVVHTDDCRVYTAAFGEHGRVQHVRCAHCGYLNEVTHGR